MKARWARLDAIEKQAAFVLGCLWTLFHAAAIFAAVVGATVNPLVALLFMDLAALAMGGLVALAVHLFPSERKAKQEP